MTTSSHSSSGASFLVALPLSHPDLSIFPFKKQRTQTHLLFSRPFHTRFDLDADLRATSTHPKIRNAPASTAAPKALISDDSSKQIVSKLHSILKPFLLRRLKVDVEKSLPPKKEYLLHAPLTVAQRDLYEHVVQRNIRAFLIKKKTGMGVDQGDVVEEEEEEEVEDEEDEDEEGAGRKQRNVVRKDYTMDLLDNDDKYFDRLEQAKEEDARKAVDEPSDALALGRAYQKRVASAFLLSFRCLLLLVASCFADHFKVWFCSSASASPSGQQHAPLERHHAAPKGGLASVPL